MGCGCGKGKVRRTATRTGQQVTVTSSPSKTVGATVNSGIQAAKTYQSAVTNKVKRTQV